MRPTGEDGVCGAAEMDYGAAEDVYEMVSLPGNFRNLRSHITNRLNTKIEVRKLQVVDLVKDLSDGVRTTRISPWTL